MSATSTFNIALPLSNINTPRTLQLPNPRTGCIQEDYKCRVSVGTDEHIRNLGNYQFASGWNLYTGSKYLKFLHRSFTFLPLSRPFSTLVLALSQYSLEHFHSR